MTRCRMRFLPERQRFTLTPWRRSNSATSWRRSFSAIDEYTLTTCCAQALPVAVRQRDAERDPDLRRGAERFARVPVRLVEVPQDARPVLQRIGRQHPVFVLDRVPDLSRKARQRDRARVPILLRFLLPAFARLCAERLRRLATPRSILHFAL